MYDDSTPIGFGKHKGTKLSELPLVYVCALYFQHIRDMRAPFPEDFKQWLDQNADRCKSLNGPAPIEALALRENVEPICTKRAYTTKKLAREALRRIREEGGDHKKPLRSYECEKCSFWHLTSVPMEKFNKQSKKAFKRYGKT